MKNISNPCSWFLKSAKEKEIIKKDVDDCSYSETWDRMLNERLDKYEFTPGMIRGGCVAKLGDLEVWVANHPYASYTPHNVIGLDSNTRPSAKTIRRAHDKYIEFCFKMNRNPDDYTALSHSTKDVPDGFYDFTSGGNIDKQTINEWIENVTEEIKNQLREGKDRPNALCRSGNGLVMAYGYKLENGNFMIEIYVTKSYWHNTLYDISI